VWEESSYDMVSVLPRIVVVRLLVITKGAAIVTGYSG